MPIWNIRDILRAVLHLSEHASEIYFKRLKALDLYLCLSFAISRFWHSGRRLLSVKQPALGVEQINLIGLDLRRVVGLGALRRFFLGLALGFLPLYFFCGLAGELESFCWLRLIPLINRRSATSCSSRMKAAVAGPSPRRATKGRPPWGAKAAT